MSGKSTVETFWPTVGTVLSFGCRCGLKRALICSSKVVFPALSSPRRRMEYSLGRVSQSQIATALGSLSYLLCLSRADRATLPGDTCLCYGTLGQKTTRRALMGAKRHQRINHMHRTSISQRRDRLSRRWWGKCAQGVSFPFTSPCKGCIIISPVYCAKLGQMLPFTTMECTCTFPKRGLDKTIYFPPN